MALYFPWFIKNLMHNNYFSLYTGTLFLYLPNVQMVHKSLGQIVGSSNCFFSLLFCKQRIFTVQIVVFWVATMCVPGSGYQCFRGICCLHLRNWSDQDGDAARLYRQDDMKYSYSDVMKGDRRKRLIWTDMNNATELWKTSFLQNGKVSCMVATKNQSKWQGDGSSVKAN
jgi:hypothetical protein